jgi:hypothetical protein
LVSQLNTPHIWLNGLTLDELPKKPLPQNPASDR